jgi:hypothetical protein
MPYRNAWPFILALIAATIFAFWRSYFGRLSTSSIGFHIHGVTAGLWLMLLLAQSWTPHHGRIAMHRVLGKTTFVAMPLFAAGSMGVIHSMAAGTVGGDPFYAIWGARLAYIDVLALAAVLYGVGMALRHRRNMRLHAGYMLSTALPLVSPVLGRVFNQTVPGIVIRGPQDFHLFGWGVQLANLVVVAVALWLWRRDPRTGRPWAVALAVVAVQIVGFETLAATDAWHGIFTTIGTQPLPALMTFGLAAGIVTIATGWSSSIRTNASRRAAA